MKVARVSHPCALAADMAMICIILKREASLQQWKKKKIFKSNIVVIFIMNTYWQHAEQLKHCIVTLNH